MSENNDDLLDLKTVCCGADYVKKGRAHWICEECKEDRSVELVLNYEAMERDND